MRLDEVSASVTHACAELGAVGTAGAAVLTSAVMELLNFINTLGGCTIISALYHNFLPRPKYQTYPKINCKR